MGTMPSTDGVGQSLRRARRLHDHTQGACAEDLRRRGCIADQSAVSKWERGRQPRGTSAAYIREYINEVNGGVPPGDTSALVAADLDLDSPFDAVVRQATDEPLLGPRQAEFVDAITERLRSGPPMTEADNAARAEQARILGLLP